MRFCILFLTLTVLFSSCKNEPDYMDDAKFCDILEEMTTKDQKYRLLMVETEDKKILDSLRNIQHKIDVENTRLLIEIIDKRGWPNYDSLNCPGYGSATVVFRHAPEEFFDELKTLIDKELREKRLGGIDHMFIDNHIQGRPAFNFEEVPAE